MTSIEEKIPPVFSVSANHKCLRSSSIITNKSKSKKNSIPVNVDETPKYIPPIYLELVRRTVYVEN